MPWLTAQKVAGVLTSAPNTTPPVEQPVYGYTSVEPDSTSTKLTRYANLSPDNGTSQGSLDKPVGITDTPVIPPVIKTPRSVTGAVGKGLGFLGDLFNPKTAVDFYADKASKLVSTNTPLTVGKTYRAILQPVGGNTQKLLSLKGKRITFLGHGVEVLGTSMWKNTKDVAVVFKIG